MDPEQGLFVILENLAVKFYIIFLAALAGVLCPKRMDVIHQGRTFFDFQQYRLLFLLFIIFLLLRLDGFQNLIRIQLLVLVDSLGFRCVFPGQENFHRHERTIFLNDFGSLVLIAELQAVLIEEQGDLGTYLIPGTVLHFKFGTAVTFPMYRNRAFLKGKSINMHLIGYHERGIKTKSEMADDLIII